VEADPAFAPWFERLTAWLHPQLPRFEEEGKSYLTVAIGCTGGQHRSVYMVERLARRFGAYDATIVRHRDVELALERAMARPAVEGDVGGAAPGELRRGSEAAAT
jgi:UPF0042 nucleotide-binding protein